LDATFVTCADVAKWLDNDICCIVHADLALWKEKGKTRFISQNSNPKLLKTTCIILAFFIYWHLWIVLPSWLHFSHTFTVVLFSN